MEEAISYEGRVEKAKEDRRIMVENIVQEMLMAAKEANWSIQPVNTAEKKLKHVESMYKLVKEEDDSITNRANEVFSQYRTNILGLIGVLGLVYSFLLGTIFFPCNYVLFLASIIASIAMVVLPLYVAITCLIGLKFRVVSNNLDRREVKNEAVVVIDYVRRLNDMFPISHSSQELMFTVMQQGFLRIKPRGDIIKKLNNGGNRANTVVIVYMILVSVVALLVLLLVLGLPLTIYLGKCP